MNNMFENRKFEGVFIPAEIYLREDLTALEKFIFTEINSLDCTENGCYASNEYLAKFCMCSEKEVSRSISHLNELELITIKGFDGRKRFIKSNLKYVIIKDNDTRNSGKSFLPTRVDKYSNEDGQNVQSAKTKCPDSNIDSNIAISKDNKKEKNIKKRKNSSTDYNIMIADLDLNDNIKELLRKYILTVSYKFNVDQFRERILLLEKECNNNQVLIEKTINEAYNHGWKDFYVKNTNSESINSEGTTTEVVRKCLKTYNHPSMKRTHYLKLSQEEFLDLCANPICWPKNKKFKGIDFSDSVTNEEHFNMVSNGLRCAFGEIDLYLKNLIDDGLTPHTEGPEVVTKWLEKNPTWPRYYSSDFAWWAKN